MGEHEVRKFAKLLGESVNVAVSEFRYLKLQGKEHQGKTLKRLAVASSTFLLTSAEGLKGVSACNDADYKTRILL